MCIRDSPDRSQSQEKGFAQVRVAREPFFLLAALLSDSTSPVSYTHLDVYKRQAEKQLLRDTWHQAIVLHLTTLNTKPSLLIRLDSADKLPLQATLLRGRESMSCAINRTNHKHQTTIQIAGWYLSLIHI